MKIKFHFRFFVRLYLIIEFIYKALHRCKSFLRSLDRKVVWRTKMIIMTLMRRTLVAPDKVDLLPYAINK